MMKLDEFINEHRELLVEYFTDNYLPYHRPYEAWSMEDMVRFRAFCKGEWQRNKVESLHVDA